MAVAHHRLFCILQHLWRTRLDPLCHPCWAAVQHSFLLCPTASFTFSCVAWVSCRDENPSLTPLGQRRSLLCVPEQSSSWKPTMSRGSLLRCHLYNFTPLYVLRASPRGCCLHCLLLLRARSRMGRITKALGGWWWFFSVTLTNRQHKA